MSAEPALDLFGLVRAFGFGTFGVTPRFGGGAGLATGLGGKHWRVEAVGSYHAPTRTPANPGVRVWAWSAGVRGCGTLGVVVLGIPFQPGVCAGAEVGQQLGQGVGSSLTSTRDHADTWVATSVGPSLRAFVLPNLAIALELEAVLNAYRPGFTARGISSELYRSTIVSPRASLGLEFQFPGR